MPKTHHDRNNISMVDLLAEAGGRAAIENVSEAELAHALSVRSDAVDHWIQMSEDNRSSPAWFVRQGKDGKKWEVGYYPDGDSIYFDNPIDACAKYIRHYLEQLCEIKK